MSVDHATSTIRRRTGSRRQKTKDHSCWHSAFRLPRYHALSILDRIIEIGRYYGMASGPGSSVGIATDYGLDGPGNESRWATFFAHVQTSLLYNGYRVFSGGKAAGAWC
jgi:hypothetical protein